MSRGLVIPPGILAYARFYDLDAEAVAQNTLNALALNFVELMTRGIDPQKDANEDLPEPQGD